MRTCVGVHLLIPRSFCRGALLFGVPTGINVVWNLKRSVIPAKLLACQCNLFITQRRAMAVVGAGQVWRTKTDGGLAAEQ